MWPIDPKRIIGGGNARPPDPDGLVDIEVEPGRTFLPALSNPVLGGAYAIPLDGSSISNDLLRAVSGPAEAGSFALPVDPATFVADPLRVLRPLLEPHGGRVVVESTDAITVRDDGPGRGATVLLYPADRLGNAADPTAAGLDVALEVGPGLRIAAPDTDADPSARDGSLHDRRVYRDRHRRRRRRGRRRSDEHPGRPVRRRDVGRAARRHHATRTQAAR